MGQHAGSETSQVVPHVLPQLHERKERGERREKREKRSVETREAHPQVETRQRHDRDTTETRQRHDRDTTETHAQVVPDVVPQVHLIFGDSWVVVRAALVSQYLINVDARKVVQRSIGAVSRYLKIVPLLLRQILHPVGLVS